MLPGRGKGERQKTALEREFIHFLATLTTPKSLASALPCDNIAFLVWKDKKGKTKVHGPTCPALGNSRLTCASPTRLAFGMLDSLIGKLSAVFTENGKGSEWHSLLGVGNPAACRLVKAYLADIREEQLKARVTPRQAEHILSADLAVISSYLEGLLLDSSELSAIQIFFNVRDQALFQALFYAGDCAADMLQIRVSDILYFPDNSGFLFNHIWPKTLRSGDSNVFAFK